jgi:hypothetical protein
MMDFDVFVSYSSKDKATADATCATLEAAGVRCWMAPRDIVPGTDWSASIVEALDLCSAVVLIFSAHANASPQIRNEIARAVQRGVPIIPVRIEDITPTKSLAYYMTAVHWLDALTPPIEQHLQRLADSIRSLLQLTGPKAASPSGPLPNTPNRPSAALAAQPEGGSRKTSVREWLVRGLAAFACLAIIAGGVVIYLRMNNTKVCEDLWVERNRYYKLRGYCFQTARAVARFGNDGCASNDQIKIFGSMSPLERERVQSIRSWETLYGCPN